MIQQTAHGPDVTCEHCSERIGPNYGSNQMMGVVVRQVDTHHWPPHPSRPIFLHARCHEDWRVAADRGTTLYESLLAWIARLTANLGYRPSDLAWADRQMAEEQELERLIEDAKMAACDPDAEPPEREPAEVDDVPF